MGLNFCGARFNPDSRRRHHEHVCLSESLFVMADWANIFLPSVSPVDSAVNEYPRLWQFEGVHLIHWRRTQEERSLISSHPLVPEKQSLSTGLVSSRTSERKS